MTIRSIPPVLRRPDLVAIVGLSRATLDRLEAAGDFPKRFQLAPGGRSVGWRGDEVAAWIERRTATRTAGRVR